MEIVSFVDPQGNKLYCIGPFREKAAASRASAALDRISAAPRDKPSGSITGRCWAIYDLLEGKPRSALLAEAARQGINTGTAATQYQKWRKARAQESGSASATA